VARAVDADGNTSDSGIRTVRYLVISPLTVNAAGDGSAEFSPASSNRFSTSLGSRVLSRTSQHAAGEQLVIVATAGPDAVFDGWTSNYPLLPNQAASPTLSFEMQPDMTLTAHFLRNPFVPVTGRYSGLIQSVDPSDRGVVSGTLTAEGGFSLVARIGGMTIPVKGQFSNSGRFQTVVVVADKVYVVSIALNVSGTGQRQITGTIKGGTIDASILADLSTYSKRLNPVLPPVAGTYNVLLPPAEGDADPSFPFGIGFGKLSVKRSGVTTFVGRLGDGTPITASAMLAGEETQNVNYWPLFSALYRHTGSISGRLTFDFSHPAHDVSGFLDWYKPQSANPTDVHANGFVGQSNLSGARFLKGATGQLAFLESTNGAGHLLLKAPAVAALPPLNAATSCSLDTNGTIVVRPSAGQPIGASTISVDPTTGLVSGDVVEEGHTRHVAGLVVKRKLNQAGGFFVRHRATGKLR
jgi:hypothetical protein